MRRSMHTHHCVRRGMDGALLSSTPTSGGGRDVHRPSALDHPPKNERFLALYNPSAFAEIKIQMQSDEDELLELEEVL